MIAAIQFEAPFFLSFALGFVKGETTFVLKRKGVTTLIEISREIFASRFECAECAKKCELEPATLRMYSIVFKFCSNSCLTSFLESVVNAAHTLKMRPRSL